MFREEIINRIRFYLLAGMVFAIPLVFSPNQYDIFEWPKLSFFWAGTVGLLIANVLSISSFSSLWQKIKKSLCQWKWFEPKTLFAALIIVYLLATCFSIKPGESFSGSIDRSFGTLTILSFFVFYFVTTKIKLDRKDFHFLLKLIAVNTLLISLLAIAQKFWGFGLLGEIKTHGIVRPYSTFGHPNYLGAYLAIIFPFLLYFTTQIKNLKWKIFTGLTILFSLLALYLTLNRGGWLAWFVGSLTFCILYLFQITSKHLIRNISIITIIHILILASFVTGLWGFGGKERQNDLTVDSGSIYLRIQESRFAWSKIIERPLLGYGPETYVHLSLERVIPEKEKAIDGAIADRVHNWFLDQWVTIGIFGLILWMAIYWHFIRRAWLNFKHKKSLIHGMLGASLLAYMIIVQFHFDTAIILFLVFINFILNRESVGAK